MRARYIIVTADNGPRVDRVSTNLGFLLVQTDGGQKGSLFWVINHTSTPFGKRLLKKWLSQPLMEPRYAVECMVSSVQLLVLPYSDMSGILCLCMYFLCASLFSCLVVGIIVLFCLLPFCLSY